MASKKTIWWVVLTILATLIIGFILGNYSASHKTLGKRLFLSSGNKINVILDIVEEEYVDSVDMKEMVEEAIPKLVGELDPHSSYIPVEMLQSVNEELEGHFGGVGISLVEQDDTIMIESVVPGGPSEQAGIEAGDRLLSIMDKTFVGSEIDIDSVKYLLRGPVDSKVKIGIKKKALDQVTNYEIIRGEIPDPTVLTTFEISKGIGMIKIRKFSRTTYNEFIQAMAELSNAGCKSFILDLRDNSGGFFDVAVSMANDFLPQGKMIVYIKGRAYPTKESIANGTGSFQDCQLVVLMDESSASSSEVFAGAIQDNDRGLIIGRRSYGKGLVQKPVNLSDGSSLRLTIARYYTPAGRCIQRNYILGKTKDYEQDWVDRFYHGEAFSQDSIKLDKSLKYYTAAGRTVYGGGGIMPDIFVPRDTAGLTTYYMNLESHYIFYRYAFKYVDQRREELKKYKNYESLYFHLKTQPIVDEVVLFASQQGVKPRVNLIAKSRKLIENRAIAYIVSNVLGSEWLYPIAMKEDAEVQRAIDVLKKGEAYPEMIRERARGEHLSPPALSDNSNP